MKRPVLFIFLCIVFVLMGGLITNWGHPAVGSTSEQSPTTTVSNMDPTATIEPTPTTPPTFVQPPPPTGENWWDPYRNQVWVRQISPLTDEYPCQYTWFSNGRSCIGQTVEIYIVLEGYFLNMWFTNGSTKSIPLPPGQTIQVFIPENLERAAFGNLNFSGDD